MKLFSLLCAAFVTIATLTPTTASAGHDGGGRTRVSYDSCGRPIYWTYTCVGRDHCGRTIYQWVQTSRGGYGGGGGYSGGGGYRGDSGYDRGGYDRGGYDRGGYDSCDRGRSRSGVSFYWSR